MRCLFVSSSALSHEKIELFVINFPVSVNVSLVDQQVALFVRQLLPQVHHHRFQLVPSYEAIAIL